MSEPSENIQKIQKLVKETNELMNRYKSPYGPEAVKGMDQLYEAAKARSDRERKKSKDAK